MSVQSYFYSYDAYHIPANSSWEELGRALENSAQLPEGEVSALAEVCFQKLKKDLPEEYRDHSIVNGFLNDDAVPSRFCNIHCRAETAVKVRDKYLHANHIVLYCEGDAISQHIAAQAPTHGTEEAFWQLCLENSRVIIDLTRPTDRGVSAYYPTSIGDHVTYGNVRVELARKQVLSYGIEMYRYVVSDQSTGERKNVVRVRYAEWGDHDGVDDQGLMTLHFMKTVEEEIKKRLFPDSVPLERKTIVHCRAGVGRTGTYIVASALVEIYNKGLLNDSNKLQIINELILSGRKQRNEHFVQSAAQLLSLIYFADLLIKGVPAHLEGVPVNTETETESVHNYLSGEKSCTTSEDNLGELLVARSLSHLGILEKLADLDYEMNEVEMQQVNDIITELTRSCLKGILPNETKPLFAHSLKSIKLKGTASWKNGDDVYGSVRLVSSVCCDVPEDLQQKINYTLNMLNSNVPNEVKQHPSYCQHILNADCRELALDKSSEILLKTLENYGEGYVSYLLRDSTTRRGTGEIRTFTLSWFVKGMKSAYHIRLAFNQRTNYWQLATKFVDGKSVYDMESNDLIYANEELIQRLKIAGVNFTIFNNEGILNRFNSLDDLILYVLVSKSDSYDADKLVLTYSSLPSNTVQLEETR